MGRIALGIMMPSPTGRGGGEGSGHAEGSAIVVASDTFNRANGAPGLMEVGKQPWVGTGLISGNALVGNPAYGAEILTDGGMENWTSPTNLTNWTESIGGASTVNREAVIVHGGTYATKLNVVAGGACNIQGQAVSQHFWSRLRVWGYGAGGASGFLLFAGFNGPLRAPGAAWAEYVETRRGSGGTFTLNRSPASGTYAAYVDDASVQPMALAENLLLANLDRSDLTVSCIPLSAGNDGIASGVAMCWDSATNPKYGIVGYISNVSAVTGNLQLVKWVNGVATSLISAATTSVPGAVLKIVKFGTSFSLYYNGVQVGTTQTVSDAGIISNTLHGVLVTDPLSSVTDFLATVP